MRRACALVLVLAAAAAATGCGSAPAGGEHLARFTNARGLLAGNDVRVGGAVVGLVAALHVAPDGTAEVRFTVDAARAAPRADATAAIRPVDLLGDNYLALAPGHASAPLRGPIPVTRTSNAPRLDELLRAFQPRVRDGLKALLVEGGLALDGRGGDLATASIRLRPALAAADRVLAELDGGDRALARTVVAADRAVAQLGARAADIGPLADGLARMVRATAARPAALDAGLAGAPHTLDAVRATSTRLAATAAAATPLAADLGRSAPALTAAIRGLGPLLDRVGAASGDLRPALRALTTLLRTGGPTIAALDTGLARVRAATPQAAQLVDALVPAAPKIAAGFFENFPDEAAESGRQPFDPFADPRRAYWRGAAVFSCEAFGVPVRPGCLGAALAAQRAGATSSAARRRPAVPALRPRPERGGRTPAPVRRLADRLVGAIAQGPAGPVAGRVSEGVDGLLGYLLGAGR